VRRRYAAALQLSPGVFQTDAGARLEPGRAALARVFPLIKSSLLKNVPDLVQMEAINEAQIAHNLRLRFRNAEIYSSVGNILSERRVFFFFYGLVFFFFVFILVLLL
jgi:hypothetical protein